MVSAEHLKWYTSSTKCQCWQGHGTWGWTVHTVWGIMARRLFKLTLKSSDHLCWTEETSLSRGVVCCYSIIPLRIIIHPTGHTSFIRFEDRSTEIRLSSLLTAINFMPNKEVQKDSYNVFMYFNRPVWSKRYGQDRKGHHEKSDSKQQSTNTLVKLPPRRGQQDGIFPLPCRPNSRSQYS